MKSVYLLTGKPGTGKTSLIKEAVTGMGDRAGGFYTEEIRSQGERQGFQIVTLEGEKAVLAHTNIRGPYRVSRYGVDVETLDEVGVAAIHRALQHSDVVVIDEIGRMELFSKGFREAVRSAIYSDKKVIGTIMLKPDPWTDAIKQDSRVKLVTLTRANYGDVLENAREWLRESE
jgi:nucleoside-triphosphatase